MQQIIELKIGMNQKSIYCYNFKAFPTGRPEVVHSQVQAVATQESLTGGLGSTK